MASQIELKIAVENLMDINKLCRNVLGLTFIAENLNQSPFFADYQVDNTKLTFLQFDGQLHNTGRGVFPPLPGFISFFRLTIPNFDLTKQQLIGNGFFETENFPPVNKEFIIQQMANGARAISVQCGGLTVQLIESI